MMSAPPFPKMYVVPAAEKRKGREMASGGCAKQVPGVVAERGGTRFRVGGFLCDAHSSHQPRSPREQLAGGCQGESLCVHRQM